MLSNLPSQIQREIEYIRPMVEERIAKMEEYGEDWDDKPVCHTIFPISNHTADPQNDMLMWLMSETQKADMSVESLARRMLLVNTAAIHTTSSASDGIPSPPMVQS